MLSIVLNFCNFLADLKEIASLLETGSYTKEARRISRAIRLTFAVRRKLTARVLHFFLDYALTPGSEAHGKISAFLPKVAYFD